MKLLDGKVCLSLKLFSAEAIEGGLSTEACITIPTLEISVDMLRRTLSKDRQVCKALGLLEQNDKIDFSKLQLGKLTDQLFTAYSPIDSLKEVGLSDRDAVWVYLSKY
jgi:hypothetical protein